MKLRPIAIAAAAGAGAAAMTVMTPAPAASPTGATVEAQIGAAAGTQVGGAAPAERGAYLVKIMGCNDCHTPWAMTPKGPAPDMTRMLSGHPQDVRVTSQADLGDGPWAIANLATNTAFSGPWGVSFTANLTPDPDTGLGKWTVDTFIAAIRNGRHEGQGRPILPPMPWPMYRNATDDDLHAVFAYLQTIPAIRNRVPQPIEPRE